jgi:hypothetical protein
MIEVDLVLRLCYAQCNQFQPIDSLAAPDEITLHGP